MAQLTQTEFRHAVTLLADEMGLQRLRDRMVRLNGLVTRRKVGSPDSLADQIYMLSSGLRREVPATFAFLALWNESLHAKLGEDGEKTLETLAEKVNACLGDDNEILQDKAADLDAAIAEYDQTLSAVVGAEKARMDMLLKAVPAVAAKLRTMPLATPPSPETA
jgi:predicted NBD/HSP70 family sugar kinase